MVVLYRRRSIILGGKEGHKSFECTEGGGGFQRGGGNRAGKTISHRIIDIE